MAARKGHQNYFFDQFVWQQGSSEGTEYARFAMDSEDAAAPIMVMSRFQPGTRVAPHAHGSNYMEYIVEGEQSIGRNQFKAGDVRVVKAGTGYGPITVGQNGCTVLVFFQDGSRAQMETMPRKQATAD